MNNWATNRVAAEWWAMTKTRRTKRLIIWDKRAADNETFTHRGPARRIIRPHVAERLSQCIEGGLGGLPARKSQPAMTNHSAVHVSVHVSFISDDGRSLHFFFLSFVDRPDFHSGPLGGNIHNPSIDVSAYLRRPDTSANQRRPSHGLLSIFFCSSFVFSSAAKWWPALSVSSFKRASCS